MLNKLWLNLRLFGEDGDGSAPIGEGTEGASSGESVPNNELDTMLASLPEKARGAYRKAYEKNNKPMETAPEEQTTDAEVPQPQHVAYSDLIKSDEYKEEHKAYMDKTISDRFKKYKGIEEQNAKMSEALGVIANKYKLDPNAEDFLDSLNKAVAEDDSYFENYAMEHDISVDEAKRNLAMEQKVKKLEADEARREKEAKNQEQWNLVLENAEKTKALYPNFDLQEEWKNPNFIQLVARLNGDTTAAYRLMYWDKIVPGMVKAETDKAKQALTNSIMANQSRPIENGLSSQAASVVGTPSFKGMSKSELQAWANAHRK